MLMDLDINQHFSNVSFVFVFENVDEIVDYPVVVVQSLLNVQIFLFVVDY